MLFWGKQKSHDSRNRMLFMIPIQGCRFVPTFSEANPDRNMGFFPGFGGLIQGQIYPGIVVYSGEQLNQLHLMAATCWRL